MNLLLLIAYVYVGAHGTIYSLHSSAEEKEHVAHTTVSTTILTSPKLMGIEIETSSIKINSPDLNHKIGFIIECPFGKKWMIEEDTSDTTFSADPSYAGYDRNLELKTIGGFNQIEIQHVSQTMQDLLKTFHASARPSRPITAAMLSSLLGTPVTAESTNPPTVSIKAKEADILVRPQITYQLPLHLLPQVFERLKSLGHEKIDNFLGCLDPTVPLKFDETKVNVKLQSSLLVRRNVGCDQKLQLMFKKNGAIVEAIHHIIHLASPNVKGFCYLFLYYWYEIFNNKENPLKDSEPGPKKSLAILSRVPVSQIFDKLNSQEKGEAQAILTPIVEMHGDDFRIKSYSDYDGQTVISPATLKNWYQSIINPAARINGADLLSPPPGLDEYSMGALDIDNDSSGFLLIEVRGYATLPIDEFGVPVISNVHQLVQKEAPWFFNIH